MPLVSVITAAYNVERFIRESVDSILAQTLRDFELIVVDDASTDATAGILKTYKDARLIVLSNERNLKPARSRNRALAVARGKYIAIHDGDDVALPHRLETQVNWLEEHPEIALLGAYAIAIDETGTEQKVWSYPPSDDLAIKWELLFRNIFIHSTVVIRAAILPNVGAYSENPVIGSAFVEDYELLSRIARVSGTANLPQPLQKYRLNPTGGTAQNSGEQCRQTERIARQNVAFLMQSLAVSDAGSRPSKGTPRNSDFRPPAGPELNGEVYDDFLAVYRGGGRPLPPLSREQIRRATEFAAELQAEFYARAGRPKLLSWRHCCRVRSRWAGHLVRLALCQPRDVSWRMSVLRSAMKLLSAPAMARAKSQLTVKATT